MFHSVGAAVAFLLAAQALPAAQAPAIGSGADTSPLCKDMAEMAPRPAAKESWLEEEIRRFRGFPHLDRAYRLMQQGRTEEASAEVAGYLRIEPRDTAARQTYLVLLYKQGRYAQTACEASGLLKDEPRIESVLVYRAMAELHLGRTGEALTDFRAVAADASAPPQHRVLAANSAVDLLIARREYAEAQVFLDGIAHEADDFGFHYRKGVVAEALGRQDEAQSSYQIAIKRATVDSERAKALAAAGQLALSSGRWAEADASLSAALALEPGNVNLMRKLAETARQRGDYDRARTLLRTVLVVAPSRSDREALADLAATREHWADAAEQYNALRAQSQSDADRYRWTMALAYAYQGLGRPVDAEATLREAAGLERTPEALRALATQLDSNGKSREAALLLESLAGSNPDARQHSQLATLYEKLGDRAAAIRHLQAAERDTADPKLHQRLSYLYAQMGSFAQAAGELEKAAPVAGGLPAAQAGLQHLRIAEFYAKAGDHRRELKHLNLAAGAALEPAARRYVEQQRGLLYSQLGDDERSLEAWRAAVAAGVDDATIHMNLGFALSSLRRWDAAREEFLQANEREASPRALYYIARCYRELGQSDISVSYLELAVRDSQHLDASMHKALYDDLGFGYRAEGQEREAAAAWHKSIDVRYDAAIALELATSEHRVGNTDEAQRVALAIPAGELSVSQRVVRAELIAEVLESEGQFSGARAALIEADGLDPTPQRAYRLGLLAQRAANDIEAVEDYEEAVARDPDSPLYAQSLAYAYARVGQAQRAEKVLEGVVAHFPDRVTAYRELAYAQLAIGQQDGAARTLHQAIDVRLTTTPSPEDEPVAASDLLAMRSEYASLARRFQASFYESYRPNDGSPAPGSTLGGVIPSQGGAELLYFPAGVFGRTDDALQFGARLLWSNAGGNLSIDHNTLQGGLSVRYKPLTQADFFVGAERLVRIGADSRNDWLLRGTYGLGSEAEPRAGKSYWNYWQLYADGGYFLNSHTEATYLEAREGISLSVSPNFLITPHLVLDGRQQSPDPARTNILEGGPGVSFKYFFSGGRYQPHGPMVDVLLQYRDRLSGRGHDDWVITGMVRF